MTVTPAYGRDYKNKAEVLKDWNDEKDFILQPRGCYINRQQTKKGEMISIRYAKQMKVMVVEGGVPE